MVQGMGVLLFHVSILFILFLIHLIKNKSSIWFTYLATTLVVIITYLGFNVLYLIIIGTFNFE